MRKRKNGQKWEALPLSTEKLSICFLCWLHIWKGGPSRTWEFESTHGKKTEEPIPHIWGWVNCRISIAVYEIVLLYDTRSLYTQSPAGQRDLMGIKLGYDIGAISCAIEHFCAYPHKIISFPARPWISISLLIAQRAHTAIKLRKKTSYRGSNTGDHGKR